MCLYKSDGSQVWLQAWRVLVKSCVEILRLCGINILVVFSDIPEFCFDYNLPSTKNIKLATFVNILHVVRLMNKFIRRHFNSQTLHIQRSFFSTQTFTAMYQKTSLCNQMFRAISRTFKTTKTVNFQDDLFSTKRQQRNATQSESGTKVSPSRVTQCVTCPSFGTNILPLVFAGGATSHSQVNTV